MADKISFKFFDMLKKEYIKTLTPLAYTASDKDALTPSVDVDKIDDVYIKTNILNTIEHILMNSGNLVNIWFFDEFDVDIFRIEISKTTTTAIEVKASVNPTAKISTETLDTLRYIVEQINNEIGDIYLRAMSSATVSKAISGMASALGMSKPTMSSADSEAELCEKISKETKAEVVKPKETLADYVCNSILKEELEEIKDFYEHRLDYKSNGVQLPKGILLKGPPGTGKTYAARCIAGSVDCYFMVCTASALQGMYIGSGAENIRNVFKGAKMLADKSKKGVIVFIDELDSFGSRDNHHGGAGGEEDRTINQLLAEMSGFEDDTEIMVLAATNYPERLDDALQRSGRFGRQITITYPDDEERKNIINQYFGKIKLPMKGCTSDQVADLTKGMTPADIKEIANESGIMSIRHKQSDIPLENINEAINKAITKDTRHPDKDAEFLALVTAHECGHVLAEVLYKDTVPVKVTNFAYGDAGGFTQPAEHLTGIVKKDKILGEVKSLLAGRAAEEVIKGYITTGASNDLKKAKAIIKSYYEVYNFEKYDAEKLDQLVIDKIDELYTSIVTDFKDTTNLKILNDLIASLSAKRTLYSSDISTLVAGIRKVTF